MGVILDTSVLIGAERRTFRIEALLDSLGDEPIAISVITASEMLHGCHRARDPGTRARRSAFVEAILDAIPVLAFGPADARRHAELWAELLHTGAMIGPHDLLISATALARGYRLATLNQRDFRRVAGLRLIPVDAYVS